MAQHIQGTSTTTTASTSPSVEKCIECGEEIKDNAVVVVVLTGVYWTPPQERVRPTSKPQLYHEDCFYDAAENEESGEKV